MDRKTAGLVGIMSALVVSPALAAQTSPVQASAVPVAQSYAELLEPIPNAVEQLKIAQAEDAARPPMLVEAQYAYHHHHHHHHHHHYFRRRHYRPRFVRRFHHHHHHNN